MLKEMYDELYNIFIKSEKAQDSNQLLEELKSKIREHQILLIEYNDIRFDKKYTKSCNFYKKNIANNNLHQITYEEFIKEYYKLHELDEGTNLCGMFNEYLLKYHNENNEYRKEINYLYTCIIMSSIEFAKLQLECNNYQDKIYEIQSKISDLEANYQSKYSLLFTEKGKGNGKEKKQIKNIRNRKAIDFKIQRD